MKTDWVADTIRIWFAREQLQRPRYWHLPAAEKAPPAGELPRQEQRKSDSWHFQKRQSNLTFELNRLVRGAAIPETFLQNPR